MKLTLCSEFVQKITETTWSKNLRNNLLYESLLRN